jgi:hypothetical protein
MSDRRDTAREPKERAPVTGEAPGSDAELELLALEEQILAEDAAGRRTLLAAYLRRYPEHTEALIAFATELPMSGAERAREEAEAGSTPELSAGEQRALEAIFGREAELRVAEERAGYTATERDDQEGR